MGQKLSSKLLFIYIHK